MQSPNIRPLETHASDAIARAGREIFIAKMKRESGTLFLPLRRMVLLLP